MANPCLENNGGCSDICSVTGDGRVCSCDPGFSLDFDGATCIGKKVPSHFPQPTRLSPVIYLASCRRTHFLLVVLGTITITTFFIGISHSD